MESAHSAEGAALFRPTHPVAASAICYNSRNLHTKKHGWVQMRISPAIILITHFGVSA